jgi:enoyl-CoA hydratase/carnithine racemase
MGVQYERRNRVACVTINRPEAHNALDPQTNRELRRAWEQFRDDSGAWVAVLTGAGDKAFCAGADLKTLIPQRAVAAREGRQATPDERSGGDDGGFGGITRGFVTWKPIIAAINGHCLAGGLELALACEIRLASTNAQFGLTEVRWALIPGAGGTQRLPRAIPLSMAMEMILTGNPIDAQEAYRRRSRPGAPSLR